MDTAIHLTTTAYNNVCLLAHPSCGIQSRCLGLVHCVAWLHLLSNVSHHCQSSTQIVTFVVFHFLISVSLILVLSCVCCLKCISSSFFTIDDIVLHNYAHVYNYIYAIKFSSIMYYLYLLRILIVSRHDV